MKSIPETIFLEARQQAEKSYPEECCGFFVGPDREDSIVTRCCPVRNAQGDLFEEREHRTTRNAFWMDPRDLFVIQKDLRCRGEVIRFIYHSHPDAPASFSALDQKMAAWDGEPAYPGVRYLVFSVIQGKLEDYRVYAWNAVKKEFTEDFNR